MIRVWDVRPGQRVAFETDDTIWPTFTVSTVIRHLSGGATICGHYRDGDPVFISCQLDDLAELEWHRHYYA